MKCKLIREMPRTRRAGGGVHKVGTEIDHPDAFRLVQQGVAIPADEACRKRANMTPEAMARAQAKYEMVEKGIHPDDYEAYQTGQMLGYDGDGEWIPGPNYVEPEPENEAISEVLE